MALEDYLEPEVAVTAVVVAAITSPKARNLIRRGLVYGTAGVLIAGDAIASIARNVGQGIQQTAAATANTAQHAAEQTTAAETSARETTAGSTAQKKSTQRSSTDQGSSSRQGTGGSTS